jgi:hypothetical protein
MCAMAASTYMTGASTAILPSAIGLPVYVVYFGTVAVLISMNFLVFRNIIFHPKASV